MLFYTGNKSPWGKIKEKLSPKYLQKTAEQLKSIFKNKNKKKDLATDNAERFITERGSYKPRVSDKSSFLACVQESCTVSVSFGLGYTCKSRADICK